MFIFLLKKFKTVFSRPTSPNLVGQTKFQTKFNSCWRLFIFNYY